MFVDFSHNVLMFYSVHLHNTTGTLWYVIKFTKH